MMRLTVPALMPRFNLPQMWNLFTDKKLRNAKNHSRFTNLQELLLHVKNVNEVKGNRQECTYAEITTILCKELNYTK